MVKGGAGTFKPADLSYGKQNFMYECQENKQKKQIQKRSR